MDVIVNIYNNIDKTLLGILIAALLAFLAWLFKTLVEKPFDNSRDTFFHYVDRRIKILSLLRNKLIELSLRPSEEASKKELNNVLNDEFIGYLDKDTITNVVEIVNCDIEEKKVTDLLKQIDDQLAKQISAIRKEYSFYISISSINPISKLLTILYLFLQTVIALTIITFSLYIIIKSYMSLSIWCSVIITIVLLCISLLVDFIRNKITS
jgi:hypothetical protein